MEYLQKGITLDTGTGAFPLSTDSMLLSGFVKLPKNARVLDLGSGCGTLGLLLCARDPACHITGVELDEAAHTLALENIRRNGLESRLESICADLRTLAPGNYHTVISNPPYYAAGPASQAFPCARREDNAELSDIFNAAAKSLRYGGDLFLVHKPERLAEMCALGTASGLEAKRLRLIRHKKSGPISLILLQCRKGGKPGLIIEEQYLFEDSGEPSPAYRALYHI